MLLLCLCEAAAQSETVRPWQNECSTMIYSLQQLLDALRHERFSVIPGSMRLVAECFAVIASDYPLDFLHYIGNLNLQHEPEVLGDIDAFDVMLPSTLICGSSQRCPKGIWEATLAQNSRSSSVFACAICW